MRRKFILLIIGLMSVNLLWALNLTDKKGRKQGEWRKEYPSGQVMYEGKFVDGVGTLTRYYESGNVKSVQVFETPQRAQVTMYEEDGKTLLAKGTFLNQKKEAEWSYYVEGKLSLIEVYNNGKKNGTEKVYTKDGVLMKETPYVQDSIDGMQKCFLQDGKKLSEISYKKGVLHGSYKLFEGLENPVMEGVYKHGKRDGDWIVRDEKGKQIEVLQYKDGVLLNDKELKKKYSEQYDKNEQNEGKIMEPDQMFK